jgi:TolA-binding protein
MAKQCTACNRLYHEELDSCPNCGVAAGSVTLPTPRIRVDFADDLRGWARALNRRPGAALAQPLTEAWLVHANSGRLPASHAPLNCMAAAERPAEPHRDSSPLSPPAKEDLSSRVEINETDIEEDSIGELAMEGGRDYPAARKLASPSQSPASGSDSEFDLRLVWNDEDDPPPDHNQWGSQEPVAPVGNTPEDFGVQLVDNAEPIQTSVPNGSGDVRRAANLPDHETSARPREEPPAEDRPPAPVEPSSTGEPVMSASSAEIELPPDEPPEATDKQAQDLLSAADSMASDDEIDTSLYPSPTLPYASAETVPIEKALTWFSPTAPEPVRESSRLSYTLLGVLVGSAACFGLWLSGLVPPSAWQFKRGPQPDAAGLSNQVFDPGAETGKTELSPEQAEANFLAEEIGLELATAVDLARAQKYPAAIQAVSDLCAWLEERRFFNLSEGKDSPEPEQAVLKAGYDLLTEWRFKQTLAAKGLLAKSHDTARVVEDLLADNKRMQTTLEALDAKLKSGAAGPDSISLAEKIDGLLKTREEAHKQAALVQAEKLRASQAEESARSALARATALEDKLKFAELRWQKSESKLQELGARQETAAKTKSIVMPALKLTPPAHDGKTAYQHYAKGLGLYKDGLHAEAEQEFLAAVRADDQDARYHYYLGLSRWAQGKHEQATTDFRTGARLERDNKPSRIFVKVALDRVDEAALKEMNRFRP